MAHNDLSSPDRGPNEGLAAETRDLYSIAVADIQNALPAEILRMIEQSNPLSETDLHTLSL